MNALILAAGFGTRMGNLTKDIPKPLLKINNTTLVEIAIKKLFNAGINKIIINTHYHSEKIISHLQNYDNLIFTKESEILESGGGIINALDYLSEKFIVLNADVLSNFDLKNLTIDNNYLANLVLAGNPAHNPEGDFTYNNKKLTFSGIGIYNKKLFINYQVGKIPLSKILKDNIKNINFTYHNGFWLDVGTKERLHQAQDLAKNYQLF